ncbi:MAG: hypothetical protein M3P01_08730 [Actinomycetota bacterium]|nr:hypothetical protein [Actinomycetota bacterium]
MIHIRAHGYSRLKRLLVAVLGWSGILAFAGLFAIFTAQHLSEGLALSGVVLVGSVLLVRGSMLTDTLSLRWIPVAWVALFLSADERFMGLGRSPLEAAQGNASVGNLVQIAIYGLVALMIFRTRRALLERNRFRIPKLPILLYPAFALASTVWSLTLIFTLVRASQLLIIVALALLMVRVWQSSPETGQALWRDTLTAFVQLVTILTLVGFSVGWPAGRFTWPGAHPGIAATYAGAAFLILLARGRLQAPPPQWAYFPRLLLLALVLFLGQTRSVLAALAFAILAMLWSLGREKPIARYLGIWYYGVGVTLTLLFARLQLVDYLARGESSQQLDTLSGRTTLWEFAIHDVSRAGKTIMGFGYGAERVVLFPQVDWTSTAHNSWIEALLGVGMIGVCLLAAVVFFLVWRYGWASDPNPDARLSFGILAYLLVISGFSETIALPGIGFGLLILISVPALGKWKRFPSESMLSDDPHQSTPGLRPVVRVRR